MIVKVVFTHKEYDCRTRVIDCSDFHIERRKEEGNLFTLIAHIKEKDPIKVHLGKRGRTDHVYIMDKGKTVDHLTFKE